ncbi:DUF3037 domain-containing protein [Pedobacter sp. MC2016-14]|uniref:DUF3037 domain-containing protein n=1 Tax=Pedobacter sp. MC2016-14 TaxID=2897327 RepID=UPI001E394615|nr:DUF3037 domain-containing protein [Pedobacter sp. MC2016-14]MCD0488451.1 DUF3037 domain-containing protein [Pedobacter sp. MC2016-14]
MQDKQLFEYAVIRVMPRVEREEFINVGVIVYCAKQRFLKALFTLNEQRLQVFCCDLDLDEVEAHLLAFQRISAGDKNSGPIALLDPASRFRWLTAMRSTVLQTSRVHPGFCTDAEDKLNELYQQLVL